MVAIFKKILLLILVFAAMNGTVTAQQFLGQRGGACTTLPSNQLLSVIVNNAVPRGAMLLVSIAVPSTQLAAVNVSDSNGNNYSASVAYQAPSSQLAVLNLRASMRHVLQAGNAVIIHFGNAPANLTVCTLLNAFSGVDTAASVVDTTGSSFNTSTSLSVSSPSPTTLVPDLVVGVFALKGDLGVLSFGAPTNSAGLVCSVGNTLCLAVAYHFSAAMGVATISGNTSNTAP